MKKNKARESKDSLSLIFNSRSLKRKSSVDTKLKLISDYLSQLEQENSSLDIADYFTFNRELVCIQRLLLELKHISFTDEGIVGSNATFLNVYKRYLDLASQLPRKEND